MSDVRRYKDKLAKIKKEMQGIYQRTKDLKVSQRGFNQKNPFKSNKSNQKLKQKKQHADLLV